MRDDDTQMIWESYVLRESKASDAHERYIASLLSARGFKTEVQGGNNNDVPDVIVNGNIFVEVKMQNAQLVVLPIEYDPDTKAFYPYDLTDYTDIDVTAVMDKRLVNDLKTYVVDYTEDGTGLPARIPADWHDAYKGDMGKLPAQYFSAPLGAVVESSYLDKNNHYFVHGEMIYDLTGTNPLGIEGVQKIDTSQEMQGEFRLHTSGRDKQNTRGVRLVCVVKTNNLGPTISLQG